MNEQVINALFSAPYLSEYDTSDREVYDGSVKLREALATRSPEDAHIINKGNLHNVWILTDYYAKDDVIAVEGNVSSYGNDIKNPYIIINSNTKIGTIDRLMLVGELFGYIPHEYAFEINAYNFSSPSDNEYYDIVNEILAGRVRKIYDEGVDG